MSIIDAEIIALSRKTSHTDVEPSHTVAKIADSVSDSDNVNDSVSDSVSTIVDVISNDFDNSKNLIYSNFLKSESLQWQETVAMQLKIAASEIPKKLDEFTTFLSTSFKEHKNKKEFISHFINWLPKKLQNEKSSSNSGKQQARFSTVKAIETITGNSTRG